MGVDPSDLKFEVRWQQTKHAAERWRSKVQPCDRSIKEFKIRLEKDGDFNVTTFKQYPWTPLLIVRFCFTDPDPK